MSEPLFVHRRPVLFQDIDAAGVVFYPRVLEWFHDAYAGWLERCALPLATVLREHDWGLPIVHAEADYTARLRFGDAVTVSVVSVLMRERSFALEYEVRNAEGEVLSAKGSTVHACLDRKSGRSRALPPELVAALGRHAVGE